MAKARKMYKMVPVSPELYSILEEWKDSLGCSSFDELFSEFVGKKKLECFGCWKDEPWLKEFKRDKFDRI
ncbi:MAG: hypothetical protein V1708_02425 [Candidatus Micrarchaeota archaeon]